MVVVGHLVTADVTETMMEADALQPTYGIWILDQTLFVKRPESAHRDCLRDDQERRLVDHRVIQLFDW